MPKAAPIVHAPMASTTARAPCRSGRQKPVASQIEEAGRNRDSGDPEAPAARLTHPREAKQARAYGRQCIVDRREALIGPPDQIAQRLKAVGARLLFGRRTEHLGHDQSVQGPGDHAGEQTEEHEAQPQHRQRPRQVQPARQADIAGGQNRDDQERRPVHGVVQGDVAQRRSAETGGMHHHQADVAQPADDQGGRSRLGISRHVRFLPTMRGLWLARIRTKTSGFRAASGRCGTREPGMSGKSVQPRPIDQRVARTRGRLAHALISLGQTRDIDDIRIGDLVRTAGVGRSTFYAHFEDRDDFLGGRSPE